MSQRFTRLGRRIDARFKESERRADLRFDAIDARFEAIDARFEAIDARFARLERHVMSLGEKIDSTNRTVNAVKEIQSLTAEEYKKRLTDLETAVGL